VIRDNEESETADNEMRDQRIANLRAACEELCAACNLVGVRMLECEDDSELEETDVVARTLARVASWVTTKAVEWNGHATFDHAELRIHLREFGWDDDDTVMLDVELEERVHGEEIRGRVEGAKELTDREKRKGKPWSG